MPTQTHAAMLLLLWLLPLVTMSMAAVLTARYLRSEDFQLVKQSTRSDTWITWDLGLDTLYDLRVVLVLAFVLLLVLIDDTPLGGASTALCLAGLHLAGSMLGTVLVLRWGQQRLGVVLTTVCGVSIFVLLSTLISSILAPGLASTSLHPIHFRLSTILLRWELRGPLLVAIAAILPALIGWMVGLIPWRGREEDRQSRQDTIGLLLAVGLALGLWVIDAIRVEARERQALVALYEATGGEHWYKRNGWLSNQPVCSWSGVSCACGRVSDLNLSRNNMQGELPPEIGRFTSLTWLDLSDNQLTTLPPEIGQLASLRYPVLSNNQLTALPPEIGQLADLQYLGLSGNQLTRLPPEIGQLTSLGKLELGGNQLTELPPEIGHLTSLEFLDLPDNRLTTLPPEIVQLTRLGALDLSDNGLTTLPQEIVQLNLRGLYLSDNQLTTLPPEIGQLTSLSILTLSGNRLTTLPPEIGQFTSLHWLVLSNNQLTALPPEIGQLANLGELKLSGNQLAELPPEIGQLTDLQHLDLSGNQLTELPPEIIQLTNLKELLLSNNQLTELPPETCQKLDLQIDIGEALCGG